MVEKWLLQVEEMMLASVRQVLQDGIKGYIEVIIPELYCKIRFHKQLYLNRLFTFFLTRETCLKLSGIHPFLFEVLFLILLEKK